jgi:hypothetical protein
MRRSPAQGLAPRARARGSKPRRPPEVEDLKWLWLHWGIVNEGVLQDPERWKTDAVSRDALVAQLALSEELKQRLGLGDGELVEDEEDRPTVPAWLEPSGRFPPTPAAAVLTVVRWWLVKGETELALAWDHEREDFIWGWHGGLWSRLGRHLLYAVRAARGGSNCHGCGRFVRHRRTPKRGQQVWCHRLSCKRIQQREAKQRSRNRRASGRTNVDTAPGLPQSFYGVHRRLSPRTRPAVS